MLALFARAMKERQSHSQGGFLVVEIMVALHLSTYVMALAQSR
jgi:hypothetical protein